MAQTFNDSETLAEGQQVFTAAAFVIHYFDQVPKVFLPKRAALKKFLPNVFELPGGHINFGEELITGLKREIIEELHKEINVGDPYYVFTYLNEVKKSHSLEVVYFAKFVNSIDDIQLNPADHSEYLWADEKKAIELYQEKGEADLELPAIIKGFELLNGQNLNFG
jgi:8-oxo-dGTP pyrophosphatase MutT (NUDIX family)